MKLAHPQLDTVFDFASDRMNTLVIENPGFFRRLLGDMDAQLRGYPGSTVLSDKDTPLDFGRNAEIIDSFLNFQLNRKPLLTRLLTRLETVAATEDYYIRSAELTGALEQYIMELSFHLPCDIFCSKMNIGTVLRAVGIEFEDDYGSDLERLLDYMELTRELERDRLFVLVNIRSYYSDEDMEAFFASVLSHEFCVLLIDSAARARLPREHRVTVDTDLCEF